MRDHILTVARELERPGYTRSLDEIAACAGITLHKLRAYYTTVEDIDRDQPRARNLLPFIF